MKIVCQMRVCVFKLISHSSNKSFFKQINFKNVCYNSEEIEKREIAFQRRLFSRFNATTTID